MECLGSIWRNNTILFACPCQIATLPPVHLSDSDSEHCEGGTNVTHTQRWLPTTTSNFLNFRKHSNIIKMAAEVAPQLVDATLGALSNPRLVVITAVTVTLGGGYLALPLVRSYSLSNRLDLFERELQGVEKLYEDARDVLQEYGQADRLKGQIGR
jgi:hypothetical protein